MIVGLLASDEFYLLLWIPPADLIG